MPAHRNLLRTLQIGLSLLAALVVVFPVYWMIRTTMGDPLAYPPPFLPTDFSLQAYVKVFEHPLIWRWMGNTLFVAGGTVAVNLICSSLGAYALARLPFKGKNLVLLLVLSTQMMSQALLVTPMFRIFSNLGWINTLGVLILADTALTLPLSTWILVRFFERVPKELEEAALIDGSSRMGVYRRIVLPLASPALVTVAILTFFDAWNEYIFGYTFTNTAQNWVASVGLSSFMGQFLIEWRSLMIMTSIFILLPVAFYVIFERYIVSGLVEGALKE
ncbi:carbohydrate ABC transporter permease [Limnochorda pilosa]|uniref:ABC transmembrane type-1 domain-containing protein n=1 Tax=Limnochorda pilosa TaxID=1555112 RepID=A0A0K2SLZ5_LIMPI|nr:carbohydrate ABC transporter permease [Limnochorda pilosa]BAS27849.1 hypothetical protein LIP_2008 [Limnochorda pilosa]